MIVYQMQGEDRKLQVSTPDQPVPRKGERVQILNTEIDGRVLDVRYVYRRVQYVDGSPGHTVLDCIMVELEGWKTGFGKD